MNLDKNHKYSIRKYKIGILSTLIATVVFLANPTGRQVFAAEESQASQASQAQTETLNSSANANALVNDVTTVAHQTNELTKAPGPTTQTEERPFETTTSTQNQSIAVNTPDANAQQPNLIQSDESSHVSNSETTINDLHTTQLPKAPEYQNTTMLTEKEPSKVSVPDELIDVTKRNHNNSTSDKPQAPAITEVSSEKPKKRTKRDLTAARRQAVVGDYSSYDPVNDPGVNNALGSNIVLTFDYANTRTSSNRTNPTVKIVGNEEIRPMEIIDGGKVGLLNASLVRTNMFDSGKQNIDQAQDNVAALGRALATDTSNHGDFNGIRYTDGSIKPNSEIVLDFSTMTTGGGQGAVELIARDPVSDVEFARTTITDSPNLHLLNVPENTRGVRFQFIPKNDAITNFNAIPTNKDGYKYYAFLDSIGVYSGSHVYIDEQAFPAEIKNNSKDSFGNVHLYNNGSSPASLAPGDLVYKLQLPPGINYVDGSLTTRSLAGGNSPYGNINPFTAEFDSNTRTLKIISNGVTAIGGASDAPKYAPKKYIEFSFKLSASNFTTPQEVTMTENVTSKTYTESIINGTLRTNVVGGASPITMTVIMNKDVLINEVARTVNPNNYTYASIQEFNKLKRRAQAIIDEETNNVPISQRASQADIDALGQQMTSTLVDSSEANRRIETKANEMTDLARGNHQLTQEERESLINQINQHKDEALNNIDDQLTTQDVETERDNGINTLNQDVGVPVVRPNAIQELSNKVAEQNQLIDNTPDATDNEKYSAKYRTESLKDNGKFEINRVETNDEVENAKTDAINQITAVRPVVALKPSIRQTINEAAQHQREVILQNNQATQEEKNEAIQRLEQKVAQIMQNVQNEGQDYILNNIKSDGQRDIEAIVPNAVKKQEAKNNVLQAANAQKAVINQDHEATLEERQVALKAVDDAVKAANQAIDQAQTDGDVDRESTGAQNKINSTEAEKHVRANARAAIDAKAQQRIADIKNQNDSTDEEQEVAINRIKEIAQRKKSRVDNEYENMEVEEDVTTGSQEMDSARPAKDVKFQAKQEVFQKSNEKKTLLEQTPDATEEEIRAAKDEVDQLKASADEQITNARKTANVEAIKNQTLQDINNVQPRVRKKREARDEINAKAAEQRNTINQTPDATDEEKQAAINKLNTLVPQIENSINNARINNSVDGAVINGKSYIDQTTPIPIVKPKAIAAINDRYNDRVAEINHTSDATDEEKQAAIQQLTTAKDEAINQIKQQHTNNDVEQAKNQGLDTMNAVTPTVIKREQGRQAINQVVAQQEQQIQAVPDTTEEEKAEALDRVHDNQTDRIARINLAHTNDEVDHIVSNGQNIIRTILPIANAKPDARREINNLNQHQLLIINDDNNATDEEKEEARQRLAPEVAKALSAIDQAQRNADVTQVLNNSRPVIEATVPLVQVKPEARQAINQKAEQQRQRINQDQEATAEERQQALQKVDDLVAKALDSILNDHTNQQVADTKDQALTQIAQVVPEHVVRADARQALQQQFTNQQHVIEMTPDATDEEKASAINKLNSAYQRTLANINQLPTTAEVESTEQQGISELQTIQPDVVTKSQARAAVNQKAQEHIALIKQQADATTEEQQVAIDKVNELVKAALAQIDQAHTNQDVQSAQQQAIKNITQVAPAIVKKPEAKRELMQKAEQQRALINQTPLATDEEKQVAIAKVEQALQEGLTKIQQAQTNDEVTQAEQYSADNIVQILPVAEVKPEALKELESIAQQHKAHLAQTKDATTEELEAAYQQVDNALQHGEAQINQSSNNKQVTDSKQQAAGTITHVKPDVLKKRKALEDIERYVERQFNIIDQTPDATVEERDKAKAQLNQLIHQIEQQIRDNQSNAQVDATREQAEQNIAAIQPEVQAKPSARQSLNDKAKAQREIIDNDMSATKEELEAAHRLLDAALQQALAQMDQATTTEQVEQYKATALDDITHIYPVTQVRTEAEQDIKRSAKDRTDIIRQIKEATREEQDEALQRLKAALKDTLQHILKGLANKDVASVQQQGKDMIAKISPLIAQKPDAKARLAQQYDTKKAELEAEPNATIEEINEALRQLDLVYQQAQQAIEQAEYNQQVADAETNGFNEITNIKVNMMKKQQALKEIHDASAQVLDMIDHLQKVNPQAKQQAQAAVKSLVAQMQQELQAARTNQQVDDVLKQFHVKLKAIEALINYKEQSLMKVDEVAQQTRAKFRNIATVNQLAKVEALIKQYIEAAAEHINNGLTIENIDSATQQAIAKILAIKLEQEPSILVPDKLPKSPKPRVTCIQPVRPKTFTKVDCPSPDIANHSKTSTNSGAELPNTGDHSKRVPYAELTLVAGLALLARKRSNRHKQS